MYVLFFMSSSKQSPFLAASTWFLILGKIQDGDHCWWRHRPPVAPPPQDIPHLVEKIKGFPLKVKSSRKTATFWKTLRGGGSIHPNPPPLVALWGGSGLNLSVRPRVKFHVHQWHTDCEQNAYLYSRLTNFLILYFLRLTCYLVAQVQFYVLLVFLMKSCFNLAMPCGHR